MSDTIRLVPDENWDNVKTLVGIPREINLPTCPRAKLYLEDDGRILVWRTWRTWRNRCERYTRYDSWEAAEKAVIKWAKTRARKIEKDNDSKGAI